MDLSQAADTTAMPGARKKEGSPRGRITDQAQTGLQEPQEKTGRQFGKEFGSASPGKGAGGGKEKNEDPGTICRKRRVSRREGDVTDCPNR